MDLRQWLRVLRRGWQVIVALVVLGTAAGIGLTFATTKVFQADVQVFVATSTAGTSSDLNNGNTFAQDRVQSYTSIANSPSVTSAVIKQLGLNLSEDELSDKITADAPLNKVLINLHVTDHSPAEAAAIANSVARQFSTVVQNTEQTDADGKPVVKLTVIHPADVPTSAIKPNKILNIGLGFVVGLLLGIGIVILRDVLDNTVKGPEDFVALDIPVLGTVPFDKSALKQVIAFRDDPHGTRAESYRQLRTNLQFVNVDSSPRIIAITSAVPGEGKSTTAMNLASSLAEGGFRVCIIEADLRRPTIGKVLGLSTDVGFTTALIGRANVLDVIQAAGRNLDVLTCGPVPPNPSELLISDAARAIIQEVAAGYDFTIIDTAPLLPVADGAEVAAMSEATLVVHHAGKSTYDQVERSIEALAKVGEKPVGVVLNMMRRRGGNQDYAYSYYYSYRPDRSRRVVKGKKSELPDDAVSADSDEAAAAGEVADSRR